jgi:hypothetical protein
MGYSKMYLLEEELEQSLLENLFLIRVIFLRK